MFLKIVVLIGVVALSKAQLDVDLGGLIKDGMKMDITTNVQDLLPQMNEFVEAKNMATVPLPDVRCRKRKEAIFSGVTFEGLNKMTTAIKGEATVMSPDSLRVCTTIEFNDTKLIVANAGDSDLTWNIGSLTVQLTFTMLPKKNGENQCYTRYNRLKITEMSDVVQHSSTAEIEGTEPQPEVVQKVVRYYNQFLKNPKVLKKLGTLLDICEPSSDAIVDVVNTAN